MSMPALAIAADALAQISEAYQVEPFSMKYITVNPSFVGGPAVIGAEVTLGCYFDSPKAQ